MHCFKEKTGMKKRGRGFQIFSVIVMIITCLIIMIPFLLMIISSLTDEKTLMVGGYTFFPEKWSLAAYRYIFDRSGMILSSYWYSVIITAIGTAVSLCITAAMAYPLSRKDFRFSKALTVFVFITMLFNGGLVSQYMIYSTVFHIKNTLFAYLVPNLLFSGFYVMIMKNYYAANVPAELVEAARIDGSGEIFAYFKIVLPIAKPIMVSMGVLTALGYWNDWTNGLYYITKPELYTFQTLLNRMIQQINFLSSGQSLSSSAQAVQIPSVSVRMGIAVIGVVPMMIMYPFFQRYFIGGLTVGAVKG